jgi:putative N-acetyltransferase (TIGR04045 family)
MKKILIRQAIKEEEIREVFAIRKEVFVDEQKLYQNSDIDENDNNSFYLIAEDNDIIIGTVRVFPAANDDTWVGGRLAVREKYRGSGAAVLLSKEAVNLAKTKGCRRFIATIQQQNVNFFKRLGWKPTGDIFNYLGVPHRPMEADLSMPEKRK